MSSLILSPTGPPADAKPCRQAGDMGTLPTPQVSARVCLEAQGTVTCWDAAARDRKASCLHEQQVLAHSPSTSPTPLSKTTLATKAWGQPLPRDPTTRTRGLQTRVGFIHGHRDSCVTGSCPRIAHPATGEYPCHVTTQRRHYGTSGGAQAPSPPSRLGSGLGRQGFTKAKDPSTHR